MGCGDGYSRWWPPSGETVRGAGKGLVAVAFATGVVYVYGVPTMRSIYARLTRVQVRSPKHVTPVTETYGASEHESDACRCLVRLPC